MFILIVNLIVGIVLFAFLISLIRKFIFINKISKREGVIVLCKNKWWELCIGLIMLTDILVLISLVLNYEDFQGFMTIIFAVIAVTITRTNIISLLDDENLYTFFLTVRIKDIESIQKENDKGKISLTLKNGMLKIIYIQEYEQLLKRIENYKEKNI
ncbi:hypothetical protein [uncultured Clostridium sp.]|uniref:hypothetical protein n=1 Tax=uncultured Clostridium sp. TaxID=59620 RepID=UPI002606A28B|nr:hypothetical protein [uncultured Clostridium sp.]